MERLDMIADDGVRIRYYRAGRDVSQRPIVLIPPTGMSVDFFAQLVRHFEPTRKILGWDRRGLRDSDVLQETRIGPDFDVADFRLLIEREGASSADFVTWCNGAKLFALIDRAMPGLAAHAVFLNAVFEEERPEWRGRFDTLVNSARSAGDSLVTAVAGLIRGWSEAPSPDLLAKVAAADPDGVFMGVFEVVATNGGGDMVRLSFEKLDSPAAVRNFLFIEQLYSAIGMGDHVRRSRVPALFVIGSKDTMVEPWRSRQMHAQRPDARLLELPDAAHYCFLDEPTRVHAAIEQHFQGGAQELRSEDAPSTPVF